MNWFSTLTPTTSPASNLSLTTPHSFQKLGLAASLIQTMKCSSWFRGFVTVAPPLYSGYTLKFSAVTLPYRNVESVGHEILLLSTGRVKDSFAPACSAPNTLNSKVSLKKDHACRPQGVTRPSLGKDAFGEPVTYRAGSHVAAMTSGVTEIPASC